MGDPVRDHFEEWGVHMCDLACLVSNRGPDVPKKPIKDASQLALSGVSDEEWERFEEAMEG